MNDQPHNRATLSEAILQSVPVETLLRAVTDQHQRQQGRTPDLTAFGICAQVSHELERLVRLHNETFRYVEYTPKTREDFARDAAFWLSMYRGERDRSERRKKPSKKRARPQWSPRTWA